MNLLEFKSNNQKKLHAYEKSFSNIVDLYDKKKLPNKILLSGQKGIGKSTLAYHLINYIFSKNEKFPYDIKKFEISSSNKSYNLVLNNSHPNFHLIDLHDDKKIIEISQIREMYNYANKSAFNNKERIILIDNAENLNLNSSNALLKIVEEPNDNVFFILILDNEKKILKTLRSRCLKFNLFLSYDECISVANKIIQKNVNDFISKDLINYYNTVGDLISLVNFSSSLKKDISNIDLKSFLLDIINEKHYKKDFFINNIIYKYIELYLLNLMSLKKSKKKISSLYENFIQKIYLMKKFNLDEEAFFIEFKSKVLNG